MARPYAPQPGCPGSSGILGGPVADSPAAGAARISVGLRPLDSSLSLSCPGCGLLVAIPPDGCAVVGPLGSAEGSVGPSLVKEVRDRQQKGEGLGTRFQSSPGYLRGLCFRGPEAHAGPMGSSCKGGRVWPAWRHADRVWLLVGHCSRIGASWAFPPARSIQQWKGLPARPGNWDLDLGSVQSDAG